MAREKKRSHPSAPLYYPGAAPVLNTDQIGGALDLSFPQINGQIADAQVPASAVTQHEGALALDGSQVTDTINPPSGKFLKDDGTYDTPGGTTPPALDDLTDVNAPTPADGDLLAWDNGAGEWVNVAPGSISVPTAEDTVTGTVKTDVTEADPVVYTKASSDTLLAAKQAKLVQGIVTVTTGSLADGAEETGTIALGKNGFILLVEADVSCWVRFYGTAAERTADAGRAITDDPADTVPVLADLLFLDGVLAIPTAPLIGYANRDGTVVTNIYYSIINKSGSTDTVTVDVTRLALET